MIFIIGSCNFGQGASNIAKGFWGNSIDDNTSVQQYQEITKTIDFTREQLAEKEAKVERLEAKIEYLKAQIEKIERDLEAQKNRAEIGDQTILEQLDNIDKLEDQLLETEDSVRYFKGEYRVTQRKLVNVELKNDTLTTTLQTARKHLNDALKEKQLVERKLEQLSEQNESLTQESKKLTDTLMWMIIVGVGFFLAIVLMAVYFRLNINKWYTPIKYQQNAATKDVTSPTKTPKLDNEKWQNLSK